jgi:uncharacterized protein (UPF0332 family)
MFNRLAKDEPRIAQDYATFLGAGYEIKSIVDYDTDPKTPPITAERASTAIDIAARFIDTIANLLSIDAANAKET